MAVPAVPSAKIDNLRSEASEPERRDTYRSAGSGRAHARRPATPVRLCVHSPICRLQLVTRLFVPAEEEVVGAIRHERLLTHIGGDCATGSGRRPPAGV